MERIFKWTVTRDITIDLEDFQKSFKLTKESVDEDIWKAIENYIARKPDDIFYTIPDSTEQEIFTEVKNYLQQENFWVFNETEKAILKFIDEEYKYIARGKNGILCFYKDKPRKEGFTSWYDASYSCIKVEIFKELFQQIKWEDEEPCEFRKFL